MHLMVAILLAAGAIAYCSLSRKASSQEEED